MFVCLFVYLSLFVYFLCSFPGGGISDAAIAGIIVAAAVVCVIVGVLVFVAFKLW